MFKIYCYLFCVYIIVNLYFNVIPLWHLADFCYGTWLIFIVVVGISFFGMLRRCTQHFLIFQTSDWNDQNAISPAIGIIADTGKHHQETWLFHAFRVDFFG